LALRFSERRIFEMESKKWTVKQKGQTHLIGKAQVYREDANKLG
jgi:hypothetical protein